MEKLKHQLYNKDKTGKRLKLKSQKITYLWFLIDFLLRLVYSLTIFKGPHVTSQLYPLAHIKYLLIHHLPLYKYLYTVKKSIELKTR